MFLSEAADINEYKEFIYMFFIISACRSLFLVFQYHLLFSADIILISRFWQVLYCAFVCDWPATFPINDLTCKWGNMK